MWFKDKNIRGMMTKSVPFLLTNLLNNSFIIIDTAMTNTLGNDAISALSTVTILYWVYLIPRDMVVNPYQILLALHKDDKEKVKVLNKTSILLMLLCSLVLSLSLFMFAENIANIFTLGVEVRTNVIILLRLLGIMIPIQYINQFLKSYLIINRKQKLISIILITSAVINIGGDYISLCLNYGIVGIYISTILSNLTSAILFIWISRIKFGVFSKKLAKEIVTLGRDFVIDRIALRTSNILVQRLASQAGALNYAVYNILVSLCVTQENVAVALRDANLTYLGEYENGKYEVKNILKQLDKFSIITFIGAFVMSSAIAYPLWFLYRGDTLWEQCLLGSFANVLTISLYTVRYAYESYVKIKKDTKTIMIQAVLGCFIRTLYSMAILEYTDNIQLVMFSFAIDAIIRVVYLRIRSGNIFRIGDKIQYELKGL